MKTGKTQSKQGDAKMDNSGTVGLTTQFIQSAIADADHEKIKQAVNRLNVTPSFEIRQIAEHFKLPFNKSASKSKMIDGIRNYMTNVIRSHHQVQGSNKPEPTATASNPTDKHVARLKDLYGKAKESDFDFDRLENAIAELAKEKTPVVQAVHKAFGLHGKKGKRDSIEAIRKRIVDRQGTNQRARIISKAAARERANS